MTKPAFVAHTPSNDRSFNQWHRLKEHLQAVAHEAEMKANKLSAGRSNISKP